MLNVISYIFSSLYILTRFFYINTVNTGAFYPSFNINVHTAKWVKNKLKLVNNKIIWCIKPCLTWKNQDYCQQQRCCDQKYPLTKHFTLTEKQRISTTDHQLSKPHKTFDFNTIQLTSSQAAIPQTRKDSCLNTAATKWRHTGEEQLTTSMWSLIHASLAN